MENLGSIVILRRSNENALVKSNSKWVVNHVVKGEGHLITMKIKDGSTPSKKEKPINTSAIITTIDESGKTINRNETKIGKVNNVLLRISFIKEDQSNGIEFDLMLVTSKNNKKGNRSEQTGIFDYQSLDKRASRVTITFINQNTTKK